jgi:hypothetical protein
MNRYITNIANTHSKPQVDSRGYMLVSAQAGTLASSRNVSYMLLN